MVRTIKYIQMLLILSGIFVGTIAGARPGAETCSRPGIMGGNGGGSHVWPWGLEVPFPWNDIQGIWKMDKDGRSYYFGFRRVQAKRLSVKQFDPDSCTIVGRGVGLEQEKSVVAQITNPSNGHIYRVTLHAFNVEDTVEPIVSDKDEDHVMVGCFNGFNTQAPDLAVQMVRISDHLEFQCGDPDKKLKF